MNYTTINHLFLNLRSHHQANTRYDLANSLSFHELRYSAGRADSISLNFYFINGIALINYKASSISM